MKEPVIYYQQHPDKKYLEEVYPGVDLTYYGNGQHMEYDFRVSVRRTRSALGQIKDVLPTTVLDRFREEMATPRDADYDLL